MVTRTADEAGMKLEEALHVLNEAAGTKKDEILKLLNGKYTEARRALAEVATANGALLAQARKTAEKNVRKDPLKAVAWVAATAALTGYCLGACRSR